MTTCIGQDIDSHQCQDAGQPGLGDDLVSEPRGDDRCDGDAQLGQEGGAGAFDSNEAQVDETLRPTVE